MCNNGWERPPEYDDPPDDSLAWWQGVAEAKQAERDAALDQLRAVRRELDVAAARVNELERALRYAAECATLEMVRDTARGMGVIQ